MAVWRERFRRLNYGALLDAPLIRAGDAEVYTYDELRAHLPSRPTAPAEMGPRDVLVRATVLTPRLGPDRYFGDEISFVLRPSNGRYLINSVVEDFVAFP